MVRSNGLNSLDHLRVKLMDRFKEKPGLLGENARYVNRFLDTLRENGSLHQKVMLAEGNQSIRVEIDFSTLIDSLRFWMN